MKWWQFAIYCLGLISLSMIVAAVATFVLIGIGEVI